MDDFYPSSRSIFRTRAIDVTFTVILGLFTCVFGYYVFTSIRNFKAAKAKKALVARVATHYNKTTHRHKKHHLNFSAKSSATKILVADMAKALPYQQPIGPPQIYTDKNSIGNPTIANVTSDEAKPASVISNTEKQPVKEALPYTTNLKANETGVINMRKLDNYGSEIIKVIPTNAEVAVLERGNSYYKVLFENTTGYVAKWNVLKK